MDTSQDTPTKDGSTNSWKTVEDLTNAKDEVTMRDYSEDIDSLLVLAGLFSAVVTAFIAISVDMLQEDSGQTTTELLSGISKQLSSMTIAPPYLNSSAVTTPDTPFQPTSAARWINSLWFVSLILSLASAVLGILAKQWIREYLKWRSPVSHPRENVLVRELRSEAWKTWQAEAIISCIPILLEIAIILFTCGTEVYVFTLDLVVGATVTICIVLFLLLVVILTVLPVIYKHCPYKSPTVWVLLRLCYGFSHLYSAAAVWTSRRRGDSRKKATSNSAGSSSVSQINYHFATIHSDVHKGSEPLESWRERDLQSLGLEAPFDRWGQHKICNDLFLGEIEHELRESSLDESLLRLTPSISEDAFSPQVLHAYNTALKESDLLFKALVLYILEAQSESALQCVARCAESIHPGLTCAPDYSGVSEGIHLAEVALDGSFRTMSICYMLSRLDSTGSGYMGALKSQTTADQTRMSAGDPQIPAVLEALEGWILDKRPHRTSSCTFLPPQYAADGNAEYQEPPLHNAQYIVMNYVLAFGLHALLTMMLNFNAKHEKQQPKLIALLHRRAEQIISAIRMVTFYWDSASPLRRVCRWSCAEVMAGILRHITQSPTKWQFDELFPTLRTQIFLLLVASKYPIRREYDDALYLERCPSSVRMDCSRWLTLAMEYPIPHPNSNGMTSTDDLGIYAQVFNQALRGVQELSTKDIDSLCEAMKSALKRVASTANAQESIDRLSETWLIQMFQKRGEGCDRKPVICHIQDRSPAVLLRLLQAFASHTLDTNLIVSTHLLHLLLLIHPTQAVEAATVRPQPEIMLQYSMPSPSIDQNQDYQWTAFTIDTVHRWTTAISFSSSEYIGHCEKSIREVLVLMAIAVHAMKNQGLFNSQHQGCIVQWLKSLQANDPSRPSSPTVADILRKHAHEAFRCFLGSLKEAADRVGFYDDQGTLDKLLGINPS